MVESAQSRRESSPAWSVRLCNSSTPIHTHLHRGDSILRLDWPWSTLSIQLFTLWTDEIAIGTASTQKLHYLVLNLHAQPEWEFVTDHDVTKAPHPLQHPSSSF